MSKSKNKNVKKPSLLYIIAGLLVVLVVATSLLKNASNKNEATITTKETNATKGQLSETGDLIIPIADISDQAQFYKYDADGTMLEVLAIKASDGTIRTAFNTCQVCFGSGRGYYEQVGNQLVCQNCGNRFSQDDVEVTKGGCNPVPIQEADKTVDNTNITISKEFLNSAKELFDNWKL
ncbi:MAG: DUF2318 domain-containing protein [Candidatus Galacturonibacter soehngenii]|nr:DUF2318 domain-containing protein [Candidatus Galacturonibacter soehngenii]